MLAVKTDIDLVVIGAGVPGVTVAATLAEMGLRPLRDFVVFDAEPQPGGSWGRGWDFQTVGHTPLLAGPPGLSELGIRLSDQDPEAIVRDIMPPLMRRYEDAYDLYVARPVRVLRVEAMRRSPLLTVHIQVGTVLPARSRRATSSTRRGTGRPRLYPGIRARWTSPASSCRLHTSSRWRSSRASVCLSSVVGVRL